MQKNLLLIPILILFSYASNGAETLPPLPDMSTDSAIIEHQPAKDDRSIWRKMKSFVGMSDKNHEPENIKKTRISGSS